VKLFRPAFAFLLLAGALSAAASPALTLVRDTVADARAFNFPSGKWGASINGQTFQQEALVSYRGYQYAAYYAAPGHPAVARRALPDGAWQQAVLSDYGPVRHGNVHNVIVIGIAPSDGSIHLAFDHHAQSLKYRRSIPGVASDPAKHPWTPALFGPTRDNLDDGRRIGGVTYPQFFSSSDGVLTFAYRTGGSGNGDWHLREYRDSRWHPLGLLFSKAGEYAGKTSRSAYPNPFRYDRNNRLHVTWSWREQGSDLTGNHDLAYAYSDDHGRTWHDNAGEFVAALSASDRPARAISVDNDGTIALPLRHAWGMMNTTTQFVDGKGRVHVVVWRNPDDAPAATVDKNRWRYEHCWRGVDGVWQRRMLPFKGRKPQIVADDKTGRLHVVFGENDKLNYDGTDPGVNLAIATAEERDGWTAWNIQRPLPKLRFHGEPLLDVGRWERERVLSVYFQQQPSAAGDPAPLHVIDFAPAP
jgi:hypothetical protein